MAESPAPAGPERRALLLRWLLPAAVVIFLVDRVSKWLIIEGLGLPVLGSYEVWPPYLQFRMLWNTGINFGIGAGGGETTRWLLIALSIAISIGVVWWVLRRGTIGLAIGAGVLVGGAIGNAWDRVVYGAVADFLNMSCCGIDNPFSFNVADVAIFAGALWIALKAS